MGEDVPRRTLRELIARHGTGLCSDARRCEGLLRDLCGAHRREINILMGALEERVPLDLLAGQNSMPRGLLLSRLSKRLEEQLALTEGAARWAVDSWALALGVVTDAELEERDRAEREKAEREKREKEERERREASRARAAQPPAPAEDAPKPRPQAAPPRPKPPPPLQQQQRRQPSPPIAAPPARRHAPPPTITTVPTQAQRRDPRGAGRKWRGCLVGCVLLVLLSVVLFVGVPYVVSVLREEQQGVGPPPARAQ